MTFYHLLALFYTIFNHSLASSGVVAACCGRGLRAARSRGSPHCRSCRGQRRARQNVIFVCCFVSSQWPHWKQQQQWQQRQQRQPLRPRPASPAAEASYSGPFSVRQRCGSGGRTLCVDLETSAGRRRWKRRHLESWWLTGGVRAGSPSSRGERVARMWWASVPHEPQVFRGR